MITCSLVSGHRYHIIRCNYAETPSINYVFVSFTVRVRLMGKSPCKYRAGAQMSGAQHASDFLLFTSVYLWLDLTTLILIFKDSFSDKRTTLGITMRKFNQLCCSMATLHPLILFLSLSL
jgi:hypothetical protein